MYEIVAVVSDIWDTFADAVASHEPPTSATRCCRRLGAVPV